MRQRTRRSSQTLPKRRLPEKVETEYLPNEHREEGSMVADRFRGTTMDYEMFCYCLE